MLFLLEALKDLVELLPGLDEYDHDAGNNSRYV
jgi:hypothetical protein